MLSYQPVTRLFVQASGQRCAAKITDVIHNYCKVHTHCRNARIKKRKSGFLLLCNNRSSADRYINGLPEAMERDTSKRLYSRS